MNLEESCLGVDEWWSFCVKISPIVVAEVRRPRPFLLATQDKERRMIAMPFGIGKKRSKPMVEQQTQSPSPAAAAPPPPPAGVPADWAATLHAAGPKGRFVQGQNAKIGYKQ
ncbi:MAG TPA: hypothetical protein VG165_10160 [Solirubrobacteraceae bacterium]|nr:hypothetical protein [Solirubrobacteraceae bacterium]